ncbi:AsnC family protein [Paenibacillus sp. IHBB 10380]|nr:AsnC family protein [Paenibacillus sp. IHBB 10380]
MLDNTDRKIPEELLTDGRIIIKELGEGLSKAYIVKCVTSVKMLIT